MREYKVISDRIKCVNPVNDGVPSGGCVDGIGIRIDWQNGALGRGEDRKEPNGAFLDTVIYSALQKLRSYQDSKFKCLENELAIEMLEDALMMLNFRSGRREILGTEGTHEVD